MKVELQCGDTITIPEGCKAVVKDGSVVFEKEEEFKDGDILACAAYVDTTCPFIYKETDEKGLHSYYVGLDFKNQLSICDNPDYHWGSSVLRLATDEEKQLLFDKMREQRLQWNAEKKRVEKIRWRAKKGDDYYFIDSFCYLGQDREDFQLMDDKVYNSYNYFRTKEQAEEAARRVKEILRKFHEEIGE